MKARTYFESMGRRAQALGRSRNTPIGWTVPQRMWFVRGWRVNQSREIQQALKAGLKYVICPGWVQSVFDGKSHYVGAGELAALYGVRLSDCHIMPWGNGLRRSDRITARDLNEKIVRGELIALSPRISGRYQLPDTDKPAPTAWTAQQTESAKL